jgi:hypothetical protein
MSRERPLVLEKGVTVSIDGIPVKNVSLAKVYTNKKEVEIHADTVRRVTMQ